MEAVKDAAHLYAARGRERPGFWITSFRSVPPSCVAPITEQGMSHGRGADLRTAWQSVVP
jgi:hypothetical protein